jgi:hypothetical protein
VISFILPNPNLTPNFNPNLSPNLYPHHGHHGNVPPDNAMSTARERGDKPVYETFVASDFA